MYDKKKDIYTEDFLQNIDDSPFIGEITPGLNAPQINQDISIES